MGSFVSKLKWMAEQRATGLFRLTIGMVATVYGMLLAFKYMPPVFYGVLLIGIGCGVWAFGFEPRFVRRRHFVRTIRGPKAKRPLRLAILGDLHVGAPHFGTKALDSLVERVLGEKADALILVGDYVIQEVLGGRPVPIEKTAAILRKTELPIIAVLGNHITKSPGLPRR